MTGKRPIYYIVFILALASNILFWIDARFVKATWANVPPVPSQQTADFMMLGDRQFAYRAAGVMLQNLGDTGGRSTNINDYDFERLREWFFLADYLDPQSDYIPFLAAYYYGAASKPENVGALIDYLSVAGNRPYGQKWRWLAQAVYLARHVEKDMDKALMLAHKLAKIDNKKMPTWTRQMPALILTKQGDKKAAYDIMMNILVSSVDDLHPNEINYMRDYICNTLLSQKESNAHPLCQEEDLK